jgi:1,4-dihydroxy-2-naphthoate octaprenyltransferase
MRIPFSVFLMPVYWFALSVLPDFNTINAVIVFLILHVLVYPASNGYNSYFDKDESSIGGLKHPPKVTKSLFWLVVLFDALAIVGSLLVSVPFAAGVLVYLLVSKAYSYDKIRLKKYPIISTVVVVVFQGAFTFFLVQLGAGAAMPQMLAVPNIIFALVSSLFLCGSYPLTQVYQHTEDSRRGDRTLSLLLGITGTFIFAAISLLAGAGLLAWNFYQNAQPQNILVFLLCTGPVVFIFSSWFWRVNQNPAAANFENTMRMNQVSSLSMSLAFIIMLFLFR